MAESFESTMTRERIRYLDDAAASRPGREYKGRILRRLELRAGLTVLDVGCGPGADLPVMAEAVGDAGRVIGVDHDPVMADEARRRTAADGRIEIRSGDAHELPVEDAGVDRARMDRVLMHVADPAAAVAQLRRVVRPGGLIALAEPDWDTLVIDDVDLELSRAYTRFVATQVVRNGAIGRQLARLAVDAGFVLRGVEPTVVAFDEFAAANEILKVPSVLQRAVREGAMAQDPAQRWLDRVAQGPFVAAFTLFTVLAEAPV
jgi:ubiquinone/menaquinone biosynthesis C-methylase UbiE